MDKLRQLTNNTATYVVLYVLFMIPTYMLPYMGSNSSVVQGMAIAGSNIEGSGSVRALWYVHLGFLLVLCLLAYLRGPVMNKKWLPVFPSLAIVFDLIPGLNFIPLIPTVMHLCAIIMGVSGTRSVAPAVKPASSD